MMRCRCFLLRALLFTLLLALWTWKLLEPQPVPEELRASLEHAGLVLLAAKGLHAAAYAFLAFLATTMPIQRNWRIALILLLAAHAIGTEIGQTFVPNRSGRAWDVAIDWAGIALGTVLASRTSRHRPTV